MNLVKRASIAILWTYSPQSATTISTPAQEDGDRDLHSIISTSNIRGFSKSVEVRAMKKKIQRSREVCELSTACVSSVARQADCSLSRHRERVRPSPEYRPLSRIYERFGFVIVLSM